MDNITEKIDAIIADNDMKLHMIANNLDGDTTTIAKVRHETIDRILGLFQELLNEIKNA